MTADGASARSVEAVRERPATDEYPRRLLGTVLTYARERDYRGWDYADAMSSRLLQAAPVDNRLVNLAVQETIKRAPINLRPLFRVEQRRNFKGTGLFAMANLVAADLETEAAGDADREDAAVAEVDYRAEALDLLDWLVENQCEGYSGFCGSHQHVIQGLHHQGYPSEPDLVSTSYGTQALLAGAEVDPSYAEIARTAADVAVEDLGYEENERGATVRYYEKHPTDSYTLNAGAVTASMFLELYDREGDEMLRHRAERLLDYLADAQTGVGGWYYRDPPTASHLSMDSHHNGFIVEAFLRHRNLLESTRYDDCLSRALTFYRHTLFEDDGAPNFDETSAYPRDIHAAAQGIITFSLAGDHAFARRILDWTLLNLYAGDGRFYFRKERFFTKRITLMRWCEAWMAYATAVYLDTRPS